MKATSEVVPAGYKQTDLGIIPDDWDYDAVDNLAHITTGSRNTQDRVDDGRYPFFVRSQIVERINSYSFDGEAVLTAGDGVGTGKVFHYINGKFDAHQRVYRISDFDERINGYFFFLYFSTHFYNRIMQMTAKSSVDSVRREMIANMLVPLPPRWEQDAIDHALREADALNESLEQLLAKKRDIKQGAKQELLTGKKRLPGFSGEWETKTLGELFDISAGGDLNRACFSPIKTAECCHPIFANSVTDAGLYGFTSMPRYDLDAITVTARGTLGVANHRPMKFDAIGRLLVLRPRIRTNCLFVAEFINNEVDFAIESTGVPQLTAPQISHYSISYPAYDEQQVIAAVLADMDADTEALEAQLAKAQQVKQGMMQELLTGRIRLV